MRDSLLQGSFVAQAFRGKGKASKKVQGTIRFSPMGLIFASEVKAILSYPGFRRRANLDALSSYLTFRQPVEDLTYFQGIEKLLPGHYMIFENSDISIKKYYFQVQM